MGKESWKRWTDEVKEGLKKMGIKSWNAVTRDRKERRIIVVEA
jgi:hypothetical protein